MDQAFALLNPKGFKKQNSKKGTKANPARTSQHTSTLRFDPAKLLNPRGALGMDAETEKKSESVKPEANQEYEFTSNKAIPVEDEDQQMIDNSEAVVMSNMIEKMHNVKEREVPPAKRLKTDDESAKTSKSAFESGGGGGIIASHIDDLKKQAASDGTLAAGNKEHEVIDLLEESDGDVTTTAVKDAANREVCYGRIENAKIVAYKVPTPFKYGEKAMFNPRLWPRTKVLLTRAGKDRGDLSIIAYDPYKNDFGKVDLNTAVGLCKLMDNPLYGVRLESRLLTFTRSQDQKPGDSISQNIGVEIVLYGPFKHVDAVGQLFATHKIWLTTPMVAISVGSTIELANPHANRNEAIKAKALGRAVFRTEEEVSRDIRGLFDDFPKTELLQEMKADKMVVTPLLSHQKQALFWMTELEKSDKQESQITVSLWKPRTLDNGQLEWYHAITGRRLQELPKPPRGGILADEMGLGKTLEVLALICSTRQAATEFGNKSTPYASKTFFEHQPMTKTRGKAVKSSRSANTKPVMVRNHKCTLIVCPLSVISNWEDQVQMHTPGMKLTVYHGADRPTVPEKLAKFDIIVTTYSIVKNELLSTTSRHAKSPLRQMVFFRIILDEAHTIRGQSTQQSKAACLLQGQRRWALTGTPVQNRLEDLGTLLVFLKLEPFNNPAVFREYILLPLKLAKIDIIDKLRALVDSVTLRRLKNNLNLPEKTVQTIILDFSEEEKQLYQEFAIRAQKELREIEKDKAKNTHYIHVFRLTLCLRQIAAHKRELLSFNDFIAADGQEVVFRGEDGDENLASGSESLAPALPNKKVAYELFDQWSQTNMAHCSKCSRVVDTEDEESETFGYLMSCFQLLCADCGPVLAEELANNAETNDYDCPFCEDRVNMKLLPLNKDELFSMRERQIKAQEFTNSTLRARYVEPSTKTKYLLQELAKHADKTVANPEMPPVKSVVFSIWTGHLDLIQIALEDNNFEFTRLDGKMNLSKRRENLAKFRDDPKCNIILVSMGAGGVGLNLTSGSEVYMMDYGFNPAALEQAIDRVHRLGQKRDVTVKLLVMKTSIEENILKLQKMKAELADISLNKQNGNGQTIQSRLEQLKGLFNRRIA